MPTNIDSLSIEISAQAQSAEKSLDSLINKLGQVSNKLTGVNKSNLGHLANGINSLSNSINNFSQNTKTADFSRLVRDIGKLGSINVSGLNNISSAISGIGSSFSGISALNSQSIKDINELSGSISKLGYKNVDKAIDNLPKLGKELKSLITILSKSKSVNRKVIDLTNALATLAAQGSKVGTASKSLVKGLNNTTVASNRASKSAKSMAVAFGKFYANWFLAVRGIKSLMDSIEDASDYIESYNYFNVALGKIGDDWSHQWEEYGYDSADAYAQSFQTRLSERLSKLSGVQIDVESGLLAETGMQNLGLNIKEITQYASQLASVTNSVGQTGEVSLAAADAFTKLAGDIGSLFNVDYSSVAQNLQSGLIGQSRALYKYGIDITNATLQTYAYELGLEKAVSEMTQAEKMQLRMIAILDQSKVSWGDLARTIESPSNQMRIFKNNLSEISIILGQLFIPLLTEVMPILNGVSIAIKRILVDIAGLMGVELDLSSFGQGYDDTIEDVTEDFDSLTNAVNDAKKSLRGFDELKTISSDSGISMAGLEGIGAVDLTEQILKATEEYQTAWDTAFANMENRANEFAGKVELALNPLSNLFKYISLGEFDEAGAEFSGIVSGIFSFVSSAISKVDWTALGENIGSFLAGINWSEIFNALIEVIFSVAQATISAWDKTFDIAPIETAIITAFSILKFNGLTLPNLYGAVESAIKMSFSDGISVGDIAFNIGVATLSSPITFKIVDEIYEEFTLWMSETFSAGINDALAGGFTLTTTAVIGGFLGGPIGVLVGAVIGLLIDAFTLPEGKTILDKLFNFDTAKDFFEKMIKNLKDAFDFSDFTPFGKNIVEGIVNGMLGALWAIAEPFADLLDWVIDGICEVFGIHSPAETMKPIGKNIILGIVEGFGGAFGELKDSFKRLWNSMANWINDKLTFDIPSITILGKTLFQGVSIDLGNIPTFESGGFPNSASLFFAGENGVPEIVGTVGGQTAVASGVEITGIRDEIRSTATQEIELLRQQNQLLQAILEKEFGITTDDIGRGARQYAQDYFRRNGKPAYAF